MNRTVLPQGTRVTILSSDHPWLEPGMVGRIHWCGPDARYPTFRSGNVKDPSVGYTSIQLLPGRDQIRIEQEES